MFVSNINSPNAGLEIYAYYITKLARITKTNNIGKDIYYIDIFAISTASV